MRRLIRSAKAVGAALLVGAVLTVCSIAVVAAHSNDGKAVSASCSLSCHPHGQHIAINGLASEQDEDNKEPAPPSATWLKTPLNLALLYIAPLAASLRLVHKQHKLLLTTQLRI